MEIGTGIVWAATILGIVAVLFRVFPKKNNPSNSKYLLEKVFIEFKEGVSARLSSLETSINDAKGGIKRIHERIDETLRGVK